MSYIENTYICLAAPLLLAILCMRRAVRRSLIFLLAGMTACLFSAYVSAYAAGAMGVDVNAAAHEISPVIEEIIKFFPVVFYLMVFGPERRSAVSGAMVMENAPSVRALISLARRRICQVSGSTVTVCPLAVLMRLTSLVSMVLLSRFSYRAQAAHTSSMIPSGAP